jgi:pimeloyl-ACP methyl ester carboxylesterase
MCADIAPGAIFLDDWDLHLSLRVRCAESTGPSALSSPWPESVYAFGPIWPPLANVARLLAVDLPGFGRSERRDDLLSPRAMASSSSGS